MTRRRRLALSCLAFLLWGSARAEPPIWRVTGYKGSAVLFGSIHLLPTGLNWRPKKLDEAIATADELWFEIPIGGDSDASAAKLLRDRGSLRPGDTLAAYLPPDMLRRLNEDAARIGLAPTAVAGMRPWLADATLSVAADASSGALASEGVERQINASAPPTARRRALESAADQIAVLADGSMAEQIALLGVTLDDVEKKPWIYQALVETWTRGDLAGLGHEALDPLRAASRRAYDALITDRNRRWAKEIEWRLKRRGQLVVVVGVGHLIGPDGLPALFRAAGLEVNGPVE